MFDAISRFFRPEISESAQPPDPKLAVAVLLVHLSAVDGGTSEEEREAVGRLLQEKYALSQGEVDDLVALATSRDQESVDYYKFTTALMQLDEAERIGIIRMMWELVFADQRNHELEDNMVWRVAELIGISARERNHLRNEVRKGLKSA